MISVALYIEGQYQFYIRIIGKMVATGKHKISLHRLQILHLQNIVDQATLPEISGMIVSPGHNSRPLNTNDTIDINRASEDTWSLVL